MKTGINILNIVLLLDLILGASLVVIGCTYYAFFIASVTILVFISLLTFSVDSTEGKKIVKEKQMVNYDLYLQDIVKLYNSKAKKSLPIYTVCLLLSLIPLVLSDYSVCMWIQKCGLWIWPVNIEAGCFVSIIFTIILLLLLYVRNIYYLTGYGKYIVGVYKKQEADIQENLRRKQEKRKAEIAILAAKEKRITEMNLAKQKLEEENGKAAKEIRIDVADTLEDWIIAYESTKKVLICGNLYNFCDIIGCHFDDNCRIVKGETSMKTTSSTSSSLGRAVVGGVVAGGVGAIIGGTTGTKNTVVQQNDDTIYHNFTVHINVNDLSNPTISIYLAGKGEKVNEIVSLMNVIISRNKR